MIAIISIVITSKDEKMKTNRLTWKVSSKETNEFMNLSGKAFGNLQTMYKSVISGYIS